MTASSIMRLHINFTHLVSFEQIIRGTDLSLTQDLTMLRGFGTSLASGVDVDVNGYDGMYTYVS